MAKKPPQAAPRRRRRRKRTWQVKAKTWARDLLPTLAGAAIFGLFLKGSVNSFDADEWREIGAMATTLYGIVRTIREISGNS